MIVFLLCVSLCLSFSSSVLEDLVVFVFLKFDRSCFGEMDDQLMMLLLLLLCFMVDTANVCLIFARLVSAFEPAQVGASFVCVSTTIYFYGQQQLSYQRRSREEGRESGFEMALGERGVLNLFLEKKGRDRFRFL
mmetsp:Transcript_57149/g.139325  ORF Transcript_57149/g.139325 Transcript_57149/m.139325 type:complete len:135 (+) Transcript_57149:1602-2006(+)